MSDSSYSWVITKDHLATTDSEPGARDDAGTVGPRNAPLDAEQIIAHPERKAFRILDSDGERYYDGFLVGGDGFEPLEDYGTPNAGASDIQYREGEKDEWQSL